MPLPHSTAPRALFLICLASAGWAFSFGLGAPLASLWLHGQGWSDTLVGLNTGTYYLGIALAALLVPRLMRRWGKGCVAVGCLASGGAVALFPWAGAPAGYFALRLLNGAGAAMALIPLETYVNRDLPADRRARNFGLYACALTIGLALGNWIGLQTYADAPRVAFLFGGAVTILTTAMALRAMPRFSEPAPEPKAAGTVELARNFPSFGTGWVQGFLEGAMFGLLPLYLVGVGLTEQGVGAMISGIIVGVLLFQLPVAWLADRFGRTNVLLGCYAVVIVSLFLVPLADAPAWLAVWLFLAGACSAAFYPLALALLGERVPESRLARANAWFLAVNCLGSLIGPGVCGAAMDLFGSRALFIAGLEAVLLVLAAWTGLRWSRQRQARHLEFPTLLPLERERRQAA